MLKMIALGSFAGLAFATALGAPMAQAAGAAPKDAWHWVMVRPGTHYDWENCGGDAAVTFTGSHFVTDLDCDLGETSRPNIRYAVTLHIEGDVHGKTVTAKVTEMGTDLGPWFIKGTIESNRSKLMNGVETGDDKIVLNSGDHFIGLQRSFWHEKP